MAFKIITLFLFCLLTACGGGGSSVAPAPTQEAPDAPIPVLYAAAYGDSTQEAQGRPHAASLPELPVINNGVDGTNSMQLLSGTDGRHPAWDVEIGRQQARIIIINHGINDRVFPVAEYGARLKKLAAVAQAASKIVILEEPNAIDEPGFDDHRAEMKRIADHMGVYFCAQPRVPLADALHPTVEGYAVKAVRLKKCIADVM